MQVGESVSEKKKGEIKHGPTEVREFGLSKKSERIQSYSRIVSFVK